MKFKIAALFGLALLLLGTTAPVVVDMLFIPTVADEASFVATAANTRGALVVGTDAGTTLYISPGDGGSWQPVGLVTAHLCGYFPAGILTANFPFSTTRLYAAAKFDWIGGSTVIAGTGPGNYSFEVYDVTTAASLCSKTSLPCAGAAGGGSNGAICTTTAAYGDDISLRIDASACITAPALNLCAEYQGRQ